MNTNPEVAWSEAIAERTASGIAAAMGRLIGSGELAGGERLPTVRGLARELGVSPATVADAWSRLREAGLIDTHGKGGTRVRGLPAAASHRMGRLSPIRDSVQLDLSTGTPDAALLPDLSRALRRLPASAAATSYFERPVVADLEQTLRETWPFAPEVMTVVDGAIDALDRVFAAAFRFGDRVLVEDPTFPPILDLLELYGCDAIGLSVDDDGIVPDALAEALERYEPAGLVLQPRAHNPYGHTLTAKRARALGALLQGREVTVVEDDHAACISLAPDVSLGKHRPDDTVLIRSFSKSHGPDLRLAAVGGSGAVLERLQQRRLLGPAWSSRLLQVLLLDLLTDTVAAEVVAEAAQTYARRRSALTAALAARGVEVPGREGINLWIPVRDERSALLSLAVKGIAAAPGHPFAVQQRSEHIRVTCATVEQNLEEVADAVADAALARMMPAAR